MEPLHEMGQEQRKNKKGSSWRRLIKRTPTSGLTWQTDNSMVLLGKLRIWRIKCLYLFQIPAYPGSNPNHR
jgi:hypothetical protein